MLTIERIQQALTAGEIEVYEHVAYTELATAFLTVVPPIEPQPAAPWMKQPHNNGFK